METTDTQPIPQQQQGQQGQAQWMPRPTDATGCPPGLEYLTQIDQILVHQQMELFEMFTDWEVSNRYVLKNSLGQQIYFAAEESETCHRQFCGEDRGFVMHITDNFNQEVMRVTREFKSCAGCCWCANSDTCAWVVTVESPPGTLIGSVRQEQTKWTPVYTIRDENGQVNARITGPCCLCDCGCDIDFVVTDPYHHGEIGKISKQWSGLAREMFSSADNFGVSFPMDLNVKTKACMIGALFLIDFMFFEGKNND